MVVDSVMVLDISCSVARLIYSMENSTVSGQLSGNPAPYLRHGATVSNGLLALMAALEVKRANTDPVTAQDQRRY